MSGGRPRLILAVALLVACTGCRTSSVREPGEPVDLPLDDIDTAVPADGGPPEVMQAEDADGGASPEGAGSGEPEAGEPQAGQPQASKSQASKSQDELGIDLRDR